MNLLELLAGQVDPLTCGLVAAFWVRWEAWRVNHELAHRVFDARLSGRASA